HHLGQHGVDRPVHVLRVGPGCTGRRADRLPRGGVPGRPRRGARVPHRPAGLSRPPTPQQDPPDTSVSGHRGRTVEGAMRPNSTMSPVPTSSTTRTTAPSPGSGTDVFEELESQVRGYCRNWPATFTTASGSTVQAEDGRTYLDFFAGAGALNYGHNHPVLLEALIDYLRSGGIVHSLDMHTAPKREFLTTFRDRILAPRDLDYRVMFPGPTGANSVESALKLARKVT